MNIKRAIGTTHVLQKRKAGASIDLMLEQCSNQDADESIEPQDLLSSQRSLRSRRQKKDKVTGSIKLSQSQKTVLTERRGSE